MIEVKNFGTSVINLSINGMITSVKPGQSTLLDEEIYKSYITIFPNLRPNTESVVIEAEGNEIEVPKVQKNAGKGKKRGK